MVIVEKVTSRRVRRDERHWSCRLAPSARESQFLRRVARRAYDENLFSVVLMPLFDPLHRDHFHLDMAR